jgi:hypothetical protein
MTKRLITEGRASVVLRGETAFLTTSKAVIPYLGESDKYPLQESFTYFIYRWVKVIE